MKTVILSLDLHLAVASLKEGKPVVFPTETVYGLGASVFDLRGVSEIFTIKGRPFDNPLIAHIANIEQAYELAEDLPAEFFLLAEKFWPGPLTMVVQRKDSVPSLISASHPTIAIRMPSHPIARRLLEMVGPMVAPSANLSGKPSPTKVQDVLEDLDGKVEYIIDGGECEVGVESTVIHLGLDKFTLLRPGHITKEILESVLKRKVHLPNEKNPVLSPGMKYKHYAPNGEIELIFEKEKLPNFYYTPTSKTLYSTLRECDRNGMKKIPIFCSEDVQKDAALMNRLLRAAGKL